MEGGGAGDIDRGGHVGLGQLGQAIDKGQAGRAFGHVAAVDQQVAIGRQRLAQLHELVAVLLDVRARNGAAQFDLAGGAVRDQVDRIDRRMAFQSIKHLLQAIARMVQHHHFHAVAHARDQLLQIGYIVFDKNDLVTRLFAGGRHCCRHLDLGSGFFSGRAFGRRTVGGRVLGSGSPGAGGGIDRRTVKHDALF